MTSVLLSLALWPSTRRRGFQRLLEPEIHRSVWQVPSTGDLAGYGNVMADDVKFYATQPHLARTRKQGSKRDACRARRHVEHDVTHCPRPRPVYRAVLHIVETYHFMPLINSHPQSSPISYIFRADPPPKTTPLPRILGGSDRLH